MKISKIPRLLPYFETHTNSYSLPIGVIRVITEEASNEIPKTILVPNFSANDPP